MTGEHVIADEVLDMVNIALSKGEHWMAYNHSLYFVDKTDVYFFKHEGDANEFARDNISDRDAFQVMHINSVTDVLKQVPYGGELAEEPASYLIQKDPDANPLLNKDGNAFTDALIDDIEQQQLNRSKKNILLSLNKTTMEQKNVDYLKDQLRYLGFGEGLENELKDKMGKQTPDFQITHKTKVDNEDVLAVLNFKKSQEMDRYFFNRYDVSLRLEDPKNKMAQTFYINRDNNFTLKEAVNLMDGRAVHKEFSKLEKVGEGQAAHYKPTDEKYSAWAKLDFNDADKYGNYTMKKISFDLEKALKKVNEQYPIVAMKNIDGEKELLESLKKGNRQGIITEQNGDKVKLYIEANPVLKTINIYDSNMQRLDIKQGQNAKQGKGEAQSAQQSTANESRQQNVADDGDAGRASNRRNRRQGQAQT